MIVIANSMVQTGFICLLLGLLTGCASWRIPVSQSVEAVASDSADVPVINEDEQGTAKAKREAALVAFEAKRDQVQYDAALARWRSGDATGCQKLLEEQLLHRPAQRDMRLLLTDVYLLTGQSDRALESAQMAADLFADDPAVLHSAGLTFEALGQQDEAFNFFRRSFEIDDQTEVIRLSYQNAVASAIEATERPTIAGEAFSHHGIEALVEASRRGDSSQVDARIADFLNHHEAEPETLAQAGKSLLQHNQPHLALHLLESAIERQSASASVYRVVAMAYYRMGDYEASRQALHFSLSLDKSSALSYFLMGATLSKLGMSEPAKRSYRRSVEIDPRYRAWR